MATFKWSNYWHPTPKKVRQIADAITGAAVFAGGLTSLNGLPVIGTIIFSVAFIAKIASNFFKDDNADDSSDQK